MKRFIKKQNIKLIKVLLSSIIVIFIFAINGAFSVSNKSLLDYIEVKTFIAIVMFFILDTLSYFLVSLVSKKLEDTNKLTKDYTHLLKTVYPLEKPYIYVNMDLSKVEFPSIRFEIF